MTIAEFKSTGSNESSFGPEDLQEIRRRKEESHRRMQARVRAARQEQQTRGSRQHSQGSTGS